MKLCWFLSSIALVLCVALCRGGQIGLGDCSKSGFPCAEHGGKCVNGQCQCYDGRSCSHCQASVRNEALTGCVDVSIIGGGNCTTGTNGCSGLGQCPAIGANIQKICKCYDDFVCPHCELTTQQFRDAGNVCPNTTIIIEQVGGGACKTGLDCTNFAGTCRAGKCECSADRTCPFCQSSIWEIESLGCLPEETFGQYPCEDSVDCAEPKGSCVNGYCRCFSGFICPQCTMSITQFVHSNKTCTWLPVKNPAQLPIGGGPCETDSNCGGGGFCKRGQCECFNDFFCTDCSVTASQAKKGTKCTAEAALATSSIFLFLVVGLLTCGLF